MAKEWRPVRPSNPDDIKVSGSHGQCECGNEYTPGDELFRLPNVEYFVCPDCYADAMREVKDGL